MGSQDASESDFIDGVIEKKGYRQRWVRAVKKHPNHPFNHGIHMDTHHLISAESVNIANIENLLIEKGYNINLLNNLVGLPATLPGACQLKLQLHRGDHIHSRPDEEAYHDFVASKLDFKLSTIEACYGKTKKTEKKSEIHEILDLISKNLLSNINKFKVPLTKIFMNFKKGNNIGCGNHFDISSIEDNSSPCKNSRNHFKHKNISGDDYRYEAKKDKNIAGNKKTITFTGAWTPEVGK